MFNKGFNKIAATIVTMSPEEFYELKHEKNPYAGALAGAAAGAGAGAYKKRNPKAALIGAALGAGAGGSVGYASGKAMKHYQAHRLKKILTETNLKTAPSRKSHAQEEG